MRWTMRAMCAWTVTCALATGWGCGQEGVIEVEATHDPATTWSGDLEIETQEQLESVAHVALIQGDLRLSPRAEIETLALPALERVTGGIVLEGSARLKALRLPALRSASCLNLHRLQALQRVELGLLSRLTRRGAEPCEGAAALSVANSPGLQRLVVPMLESTVHGVAIADNAVLEEVVLPQLRRASNHLTLRNNARLHRIDLRSLHSVEATVEIEHNPQVRWDVHFGAEPEPLSIEFCAGSGDTRQDATEMLLEWQAAGHHVRPCMEDLESRPEHYVWHRLEGVAAVQLKGLGEIGTLELSRVQQAFIDLGDVQVIAGDLIVRNISQLRGLRAPWLRAIEGRLHIENVGTLRFVDFPSLTHVAGEVRIRRVRELRAVLFPQLRSAGSPFMIARNLELFSLRIPRLKSARPRVDDTGEVCFLDNRQLTTLPTLTDLEEGTEVLHCLDGRRPRGAASIAARWKARGLRLGDCSRPPPQLD